MSNVTAPFPAVFEEVVFPNPNLSDSKWNYTQNQKEGLEKMITHLGLAVIMVGGLFGMNFVQGAFGNDFISFGSFIALIALSFFILPKVAKAAIARKEHKQDVYRRENASTVIDALSENGWRYYDPNLNVLDIIAKDNNPDLVNKAGVRYSAKQFYVGKENVSILLTLSDPDIQEEMKETSKQKEIAFITKNYENAYGAMSSEKREGFEAALNLTVRGD